MSGATCDQTSPIPHRARRAGSGVGIGGQGPFRQAPQDATRGASLTGGMASPNESSSPSRRARPSRPPKPARRSVERLPRTVGSSIPPATASQARQPLFAPPILSSSPGLTIAGRPAGIRVSPMWTSKSPPHQATRRVSSKRSRTPPSAISRSADSVRVAREQIGDPRGAEIERTAGRDSERTLPTSSKVLHTRQGAGPQDG